MTHLVLSPLGTELLDDPRACPEAVTTSLRNVARANRWFGGQSAMRFGLRRLLAAEPRGSTFTLLDIGTGLGDLPEAAVAWGARRGFRVVPVGIERHRAAAALAHARGIPTAVGCCGSLPVRAKGVDLVLVSQVAHHLAPESVVRLVHACDRAARIGVVLADLRRARLAAIAFRGGAGVLGFDPVTVADGVTSIRRGYTVAELRRLLETAGVHASVHRRPGYRLVAIWRPGRPPYPWRPEL